MERLRESFAETLEDRCKKKDHFHLRRSLAAFFFLSPLLFVVRLLQSLGVCRMPVHVSERGSQSQR